MTTCNQLLVVKPLFAAKLKKKNFFKIIYINLFLGASCFRVLVTSVLNKRELTVKGFTDDLGFRRLKTIIWRYLRVTVSKANICTGTVCTMLTVFITKLFPEREGGQESERGRRGKEGRAE